MSESAPELPSGPELRDRRIAELEEALERERTTGLETRKALGRVTDAFFSLNDLWQYTYVSPRACELLGRPSEDLLGQHLWAEIPGAVGQTAHPAYYKALTEQIPIVVEEYAPHQGRWYEIRIYPSPSGLSVFLADVTERRKADEIQARLAAVMEATPDLVGFADGSGRLLHLNPAGRSLLEIPREDASKPGELSRYFPERSRRRLAEEWLRAAEDHGVWRGEATLRSVQGAEIPVRLTLLAHPKELGPKGFFSILAHDLRSEKSHEVQLEDSEARYRNIVENAPEAIVVLDVESRRFVDFNANALGLFGLSRQELLGLGPLDLSPAAQPGGRSSAETAAEKIAEAVRGGRPVFEWIHRTSRGLEFPCEIRLVRIPGPGAPQIRGSIIDISERKRAEEAIIESEARFRQIAETIRDAFWIASPDLAEYLYISPAFEEIWGRSRKELYRSPGTWNEAIHPDDGGPAVRTPGAAGRLDNTYRIVRPDGELRWVHERAFPITDASGVPLRMVGIAEDVTELKETESELLESRRRLEEALENTKDRVVQLEEQVRGRTQVGTMTGKSAVMQEVYRRLRLAGQSPVNVLITGESGTGKELAARSIHDQGLRKNRPFIAINCSAIPGELLESELFGHVKGAFTGAVRDRTGLFQSAEGGTLFLDEVGDMPASLQVKILRAIQEREVRRVGDEKPIRINVQLLAATNRNLSSLLASGAMRTDFYYRIRVFEIHLPALRDRKDDIPLLVSQFIEEISVARKKKVRGISAEAMRFLMNSPWPGNVRELRNAVEQAFVTMTGDSLRISDFPPSPVDSPGEAGSAHAGRGAPPLPETADPECKRIQEALRKSGGNRQKAAVTLGYSRVTLWKHMRRLGL